MEDPDQVCLHHECMPGVFASLYTFVRERSLSRRASDQNLENVHLNDERVAEAELLAFRGAGGRLIIDSTVASLGRNPKVMERVCAHALEEETISAYLLESTSKERTCDRPAPCPMPCAHVVSPPSARHCGGCQ
jgi:hypothetical protein